MRDSSCHHANSILLAGVVLFLGCGNSGDGQALPSGGSAGALSSGGTTGGMTTAAGGHTTTSAGGVGTPGSGGQGGSLTGTGGVGTTSGRGGSNSENGGAKSGNGGANLGNGGTSVGSGGSSGNGMLGGSAGKAAGGNGGSLGNGGSPQSGGNAGQDGSAGGGTGGSAGASDKVNAAELAVAMGFGANIGNTLENTTMWETGWGQPLITQAFINGMASRGIKTIRLPVAWNTYAVNGVIDASKMNRVKEVVGWILDANMYAIVNIHWDGGWIDNEGNANQYKLTDDVKTKFQSYWQQIATAFASVGSKLIFEGLNEEGRYYVNGTANGTPDYPPLNTINQLFVTTVRAQGGYNAGRALLIAGFTTDLSLTCVNGFTVPSDPAGPGKLLLSIHYYTPWTFCGLEDVASWGSPATTWGTAADKTALQNDFAKLTACSADKKIPIIVGEFGVTKGQKYPREPASRSLWMQSVAKACLSNHMVPMLWDTATDISRSDGSFSPELQTVMNNIK